MMINGQINKSMKMDKSIIPTLNKYKWVLFGFYGGFIQFLWLLFGLTS